MSIRAIKSLFTCFILGMAITPLTHAQGKTYCTETPSWTSALRTQFQGLAQEWVRMERDLKVSHENFFIRTGTKSTSNRDPRQTWAELEGKRKALVTLFNRTREAALKLPLEGRSQLARFLPLYLELSRTLLHQVLAVSPFSRIDLAGIQKAYEVSVPEDVFTIAQQELAPMLSQIVLRDDGNSISIRLAKNEILAIGIRALASSPIALREPGKAYAQTVRCLMARETAHLYVRNELRLKNASPNADAYATPACRGVSIKDIVEFELPSQVLPWGIAALKENLVTAVPTYNKFIKDQSVARALESEINWRGRKFTINTDPAYLYLYAADEDFENVSAEAVRAAVQNAIIDVSETDDKLKALYDFTHTNQVLGELDKVIADCEIPVSAETFADEMSQAETVYTLDSYDRAVQAAISLNSDAGRPVEFLNRVFFQQKIMSLRKAFELVLLQHLPPEAGVNVDEIVGSFTMKAIYPATSYLAFKSADDKKAMDQLAASLLAKSQSVGKKSAMQMSIDDFNSRLNEKARVAFKVMDPRTPLTELPYVRSIIWDYYSKDIAQISRLSKKRIDGLTQTADSNELRQIFTKVRSSLNTELADLGYFPQEGMASRAFNWAKSFIVAENPKKVRAEALRKDIEILDQMSFRLGFNGNNQDRANLQEALADQRLSQSDLQKFVDHYRKSLLKVEIAEFRILDMPVKGPGRMNRGQPMPLYKIVGSSQISAATKDHAVRNALLKVRENQMNHLARVNAAKTITDLKPYILNSDLLQVALGMGDLGGAIAANDVLRLSGITHIPSFTLNQDVFGPLLEQHYLYSSRWQRETTLDTAVWDEVFTSSLIGTGPFIYGWVAKLGFGYVVPARLGGKVVAGGINTIYQKTIGQWGHYWNFIYSLVAVDIGVSSYRLYSTQQELGLINEFTYTDSEKRALLFSDSYLGRKVFLEDQKKAQLMRIGHNMFWIAFPYITHAAVTKVYYPMRAKRINKQEKLLAEAAEGAQTPAHLEALASVQKEANRTFKVISRNLHFEFKALGVPEGSFAISRLQQGLREARQSGDVFRYMRAKEAYERIVRTTTEALVPYVGVEQVGAVYIRSSVGSIEEYNAMVNIYNRLIQLEARRRGAA